MPFLGRPGALLRRGKSLLLPPSDSPGCACCPRYECVPGGISCQECVLDNDGQYRTLAECEEQCPAKTCIYCVEEEVDGYCGTTYTTYTCTRMSCDDEGDCIEPNAVVVGGPVITEAPDDVACFNDVCPNPPEPPVEPECCVDADCACCHQCIDNECVYGCPEGTICLGCECVPPEQYYYCCRDPESACTGPCLWEATAYDPQTYAPVWMLTTPCGDAECDCLPPPSSPQYPGDTYESSCSGSGSGTGAGSCQLGPCSPTQEYVSGPHESLTACCVACGCNYDCAVPGYYCFPDPLGAYTSLSACEAECTPPGTLGTCCYTIAPYSEDNNNPHDVFVDNCLLEKGCFGIMTFQDCEALKTTTGTNTTWYNEYTDCDFCPVSQSAPCCYEDPDVPCSYLCAETDESCCDSVDGELYVALQDCTDTWPSGREACRLPCSWPASPAPFSALNGGCACTVEQSYSAPAGTGIVVQWKPGYPANLGSCTWTWVYDWSRCGGGAAGVDHSCFQYRILRTDINGNVSDITATAVVNVADLAGCTCTLNYGAQPCNGNECAPLPFHPNPVPVCPP